jgi:hypothetical protein
MRHHEVQQKGRDEILADYHLRVGQITEDNQILGGYSLAGIKPPANHHSTSGDLAGLLAAAPAGAREALRSAALTAYGAGFASAAIVAAGIAFIACPWLDQQPGDRPGSSASANAVQGNRLP